MSKTVSFFSMRHLAYTEIKDHTILFSLSNSTPKVVYFLTTIFGSIYHDRKQFRCRFDVEASLDGFQMMLERVKTETKGDGAVVFALEPTEHYWMVLGQFFEDHNQSYILVHPLVVARSREVKQLNRGKTDAFDARLIAELACRGAVTRTQIPEDDWAKFLAVQTFQILNYPKSQRFLVAYAPRNDNVGAFFKGLLERYQAVLPTILPPNTTEAYY